MANPSFWVPAPAKSALAVIKAPPVDQVADPPVDLINLRHLTDVSSHKEPIEPDGMDITPPLDTLYSSTVYIAAF